MKKYFLFALLAMFLVGCDSPNANYPSGDGSDTDNEGSSNASSVVTGEAIDVTHKSATLFGEVNVEISDYDEIEWGVMYSTDKATLESHMGDAMIFAKGALRENVYSVSVIDLQSETKYYYCAFVLLNQKQFKYGGVKSFTTLSAPDIDDIIINTGSAENIQSNSVELFGELEADFSDYISIRYGISYSNNKSDLQSNNGVFVYCNKALQGNNFSVSLSGLEAETMYYYSAFVYVNDKEFKFGGIESFTTKEKWTLIGEWECVNAVLKHDDDPSGGEDSSEKGQVWVFGEDELIIDGKSYTYKLSGSKLTTEYAKLYNSSYFNIDEYTGDNLTLSVSRLYENKIGTTTITVIMYFERIY